MPSKKKPTSKKGDKGGKSARSEKSLDDKKTTAPSETQLYMNDYTNKLRESLKKQLLATKGFPDRIKLVGCR